MTVLRRDPQTVGRFFERILTKGDRNFLDIAPSDLIEWCSYTSVIEITSDAQSRLFAIENKRYEGRDGYDQAGCDDPTRFDDGEHHLVARDVL